MAVNDDALLVFLLLPFEISTEADAGTCKRLSAEAPANSKDPPAFSMAVRVSAVSETCFPEDDALGAAAKAAVVVDLVSVLVVVAVGADTTNHFTAPPNRAASMEVISPIPPGGEMTTTSTFTLVGDDDVEVASRDTRGSRSCDGDSGGGRSERDAIAFAVLIVVVDGTVKAKTELLLLLLLLGKTIAMKRNIVQVAVAVLIEDVIVVAGLGFIAAERGL